MGFDAGITGIACFSTSPDGLTNIDPVPPFYRHGRKVSITRLKSVRMPNFNPAAVPIFLQTRHNPAAFSCENFLSDGSKQIYALMDPSPVPGCAIGAFSISIFA